MAYAAMLPCSDVTMDGTFVGSMFNAEDIIIAPAERSESYEQAVLEQEKVFWTNHILADKKPPAPAGCFEMNRSTYETYCSQPALSKTGRKNLYYHNLRKSGYHAAEIESPEFVKEHPEFFKEHPELIKPSDKEELDSESMTASDIGSDYDIFLNINKKILDYDTRLKALKTQYNISEYEAEVKQLDADCNYEVLKKSYEEVKLNLIRHFNGKGIVIIRDEANNCSYEVKYTICPNFKVDTAKAKALIEAEKIPPELYNELVTESVKHSFSFKPVSSYVKK